MPHTLYRALSGGDKVFKLLAWGSS